MNLGGGGVDGNPGLGHLYPTQVSVISCCGFGPRDGYPEKDPDLSQQIGA